MLCTLEAVYSAAWSLSEEREGLVDMFWIFGMMRKSMGEGKGGKYKRGVIRGSDGRELKPFEVEYKMKMEEER